MRSTRSSGRNASDGLVNLGPFTEHRRPEGRDRSAHHTCVTARGRTPSKHRASVRMLAIRLIRLSELTLRPREAMARPASS